MSGLDTGGGKAPRGVYKVRVSKLPVKGKFDSGHVYYELSFDMRSLEDAQLVTTHKERVVVWMMGPFAEAMGFMENPKGSGKYPDFDVNKCLGKVFYGKIVHEKQTKGKSAGKVFARLVEPSSVEPLIEPEQPGQPTDTEPAEPGMVGGDDDIPF